MFFRETARVLSNSRVGPEVFLVRLAAPKISAAAKPGQFVQVLISGASTDPLLRRPFSINDNGKGCVSILYRTVGKGTAMLSACCQGAPLDVIGPLGRGFRPGRGKSRPLLVAGGMGLAPMSFLFKHLKARSQRPAMLYGCRTRKEMVRLPLTGSAIATDDGSCGRRGLVTELLEEQLDIHSFTSVFACGPWAMLRKVASICSFRRVPCHVSLEARMACGVGACQGCVVRGTGGRYLAVCSDGPVFDSKQIDWEQDDPL